MIGTKVREFKTHKNISLDDLVPEANFYRQLEENHRVDGGPTDFRVAGGHKPMNETQIQATFETSVEIVFRDQIFQGDSCEWPEIPCFMSEHVPPHSFIKSVSK